MIKYEKVMSLPFLPSGKIPPVFWQLLDQAMEVAWPILAVRDGVRGEDMDQRYGSSWQPIIHWSVLMFSFSHYTREINLNRDLFLKLVTLYIGLLNQL